MSNAWIGGGTKDATLAQQRQTAFTGESLRASLLSASQAWELSWLGAMFFGLGIVFGAQADAKRPYKVTVPESIEVLTHRQVNGG